MARLLRGVVKKDIHPRVCWAALNTIKEYCKHLSPRFQEDCHQHVLGALRKAMEDFEYPSVQAQASSAMFYFVKNCDAYILKPYLKKLVGKLIDQIERGKCMVKVEALRALSSIANSSKDQFEEFYSTVMPYLKAMMMTAKADSDSILLAASMECITIIWMVVGKERIGTNDAERKVGEVLISLIRPELEENNRMRIQVLQACGRLCKILGQDFRPYNMVAIPCLLKAAKNESYVFVPENPDNMEESDGRTLIVEGQKTWIKTEVLEQKVIACSELYRCAAELKEDFYLWIEEVAGILVPLLNFEYNEEIRRVAALGIFVLMSFA
ncbi:unnamed protein product [Dovyalis caffra]|uniref:Uncharacterized protein n=1 Tax=Dovyalis caffra TaxID=77055 RepID=A0AAV1QTM4_9ROSI|nr:unnamed protein product [Dovyalis caffra]